MRRYRISPPTPPAERRPPAAVAGMALALLLGFTLAAADAHAAHAIPPTELARSLGSDAQPAVLDVRTVSEYRAGHIPGAINIPVGELERRIEELAPYRGRPLVVHCEMGPRADHAARLLRESGFTDLHELAGHMRVWRQGGYPME